MTQEDKELLLKDLCGRLPYGVKVFYEYVYNLNKKTYGYSLTLNTWCIDEMKAEKAVVKPYLFPLSSMTEEQKEDLNKAIQEDAKEAIEAIRNNDKMFHAPWRAIDWLNANHFDYRGLIPMGLANDATNKGIY